MEEVMKDFTNKLESKLDFSLEKRKKISEAMGKQEETEEDKRKIYSED